MKIRHFAVVCLAIGLMTTMAFAGPPFYTDDPEPVPFRHYEFYTFSTLDRAKGAYGVAFPAFELNIGAAPNLQLHVIAPMMFSAENHGLTAYGVGDVELGVKYRLVQEKGNRPQFGIFPMIELPTGNSNRSLGNGQTWARLPMWVQKSWGPWTSYGGAGYIINHAPGMRDHTFAGWEVQRELNKDLMLGVEWFDPGRDSDESKGTHLINAGGIYKITDNFNFLFTAGHSVHGTSHTVAYVGLYWTWGPRSCERTYQTLDAFATQPKNSSVGRYTHTSVLWP